MRRSSCFRINFLAVALSALSRAVGTNTPSDEFITVTEIVLADSALIPKPTKKHL